MATRALTGFSGLMGFLILRCLACSNLVTISSKLIQVLKSGHAAVGARAELPSIAKAGKDRQKHDFSLKYR